MKTSFKELISTPKHSVLTLHRRPDGDSIGSNLALYEVLKQAGQEVDIYSKDEFSENLRFLPYSDKVIVKNPTDIVWSDYDQYWALDMSAPDMLGQTVTLPSTLPIIVVDHHITNSGWGTVNFIDTQKIATCQILYELFKDSDVTINKSIATNLLTGLATDSGFFIYNQDSAPFKVASELLVYGVDYQSIIFNIQKQIDLKDLQFLSKALESITVYDKQKAVILPVPNDIWMHYGASVNKNYLLTDYIRSVKDTEFGVLIIEETPGNFRLEFRSRSTFDVSAIAKFLGGGGHKPAAGAKIENSTFKDIIQRILSFVDSNI